MLSDCTDHLKYLKYHVTATTALEPQDFQVQDLCLAVKFIEALAPSHALVTF